MPRPKRPRCISSRPGIKSFVPEGSPETGEVILSFEEFEAIRLIDHEGFDQTGAAAIMNVSRQTFGRILREARYNLSHALMTSKRLVVQGGCYEMRRNGRGRRRHGQKKI
ncbi:MAG: DUF134 domain-containing protein [Thermodesulfobacteriota bacterium]|nr:DUF134 domain-containing protein [Thermodesulfobacteriota bacterium]